MSLTRARALDALGRTEEARAALHEARGQILAIASTLEAYPELGDSFLTNVVANVHILRLARDWLGEDAV